MNQNRNNPIEDELNAIRIKLYEKTKDMTEDEEADYFNRRAREIAKRQGLTNVKFSKSPSASDTTAS